MVLHRKKFVYPKPKLSVVPIDTTLIHLIILFIPARTLRTTPCSDKKMRSTKNEPGLVYSAANRPLGKKQEVVIPQKFPKSDFTYILTL